MRRAHCPPRGAGKQPAGGGSSSPAARRALVFGRPPPTRALPPPHPAPQPQAFEAHAGGLAGVEDRLELLQAELETLRMERATLDAPLAAFETPEVRRPPPAAPTAAAAAARRSSPAATGTCYGHAYAAAPPQRPRGGRRAGG